MKILTRDKVVLFYGSVEKDVFPEADKTRELYKIVNEEITMYSVTDRIVEYEVESVPQDFEQNKYCYSESEGFYNNPNFVESEE